MKDVKFIKRDDSPKSIFNPLKKDFKVSIRDDDNKVKEYVVPSMEISTFPTHIADRVKKDLVTEVINERGLGYLTEDNRREIEKEVEVVLHEH